MQAQLYEGNEHYLAHGVLQEHPTDECPFVVGIEHGENEVSRDQDLPSNIIKERMQSLYSVLSITENPVRGRRHLKQRARGRFELIVLAWLRP